MSFDNLPPGVSDSDIPGNRPEDMEFEKLLDEVTRLRAQLEKAQGALRKIANIGGMYETWPKAQTCAQIAKQALSDDGARE